MIKMKCYNKIKLAVLLAITGTLALLIINSQHNPIPSFPDDRLTPAPAGRLDPDSVLAFSPQVGYSGSGVDYLTTLSGYTLYDPTFNLMRLFLDSDMTDRNLYNIDSYTCWNYAADVIDNATAQQLRCGFVYIEFTNSAHACIVFETTDKGLVFIDPQTDSVVELEVGTHYYQSIITAPGYYYTQPAYDDTVKTFAVIW